LGGAFKSRNNCKPWERRHRQCEEGVDPRSHQLQPQPISMCLVRKGKPRPGISSWSPNIC